MSNSPEQDAYEAGFDDGRKEAEARVREEAAQAIKKEIADSFFGEFDDERTAGRHYGLLDAVKIIREMKESE